MEIQRVEYKGYVIQPLPVSENEDMYFAGYEITKHGKLVSTRKHIFPGFFYRNAAVTDSIEHAKLEIDNLATPGGSPAET